MIKKTISTFFLLAAGLFLFLSLRGVINFISAEQVNNTTETKPVEYTWTGAAGDGLWNTAGNWEPAGPPPKNSGAVGIHFTDDMNMLPVVIPAGYTAECTFGDNFGTIFGPAFGMHLDIKGSLTYKWYLAAGQTNPAGQRSVINMYSGSSIFGAEGLSLGDNWFLPGPYVTMNMYGTSKVEVNWLWLGGHLNMYGGTMDIKQGINMAIRHRINDDPNNMVKIDDSLTKLDVYAGKLILPADVNKAVVDNWISRGILLSYGHKPGTEGCDIKIDTQRMPGRTIISSITDSSEMVQLYSNEKPNEAQLWSLMEQAISNIERKRYSDANSIVEELVKNYSSNPRLPQVLSYVADMYKSAKKYDEAGRIQKSIAENWGQSRLATDSNYETAKLTILRYIDVNDEPNILKSVEKLISDFNDKGDLPSIVLDFAARSDLQNKYKPSSLTKQLYKDVNEHYSKNPQGASARLSIDRIDLVTILENEDVNVTSEVGKFIYEHNNFNESELTSELYKVAEHYFYQGSTIKPREAVKYKQSTNRKVLAVCGKIIEKFPSVFDKTLAYRLSGDSYRALGQPEKAIECYQKILSTWAKYDKTANILYFTSTCYEDMIQQGQLEREIGVSLIKINYQKLIDNYPEHILAKWAKSWIERNEQFGQFESRGD